MATLTITHADGSTETYTIDRTKFEGVRTMTVDGSPVSVDRTPASEIRTLLLNGETVEIQRNTETVRSLTIDGVPVSIDRSDEIEVLRFVEEFGQPAVAYSLRKLNSAYTGPAVRIRRTSDDVEVKVSFDTNDEVSESSAITNLNPSNLPSGVTSFTISGTTDEVSGTYTTDGTLVNGKFLFVKTGDNSVQVRHNGSKWLLWDNNEGEAYYFDEGNADFPWDVQIWGIEAGDGGTPVFSNLTGPDSGDTTATTLGEFLTEEVTGYSSNFTTTDGWSTSNTTVTANVDANADGAGVPPSNDFLKLVANNRLSLRNNSVVNDFIKGSGSGDFEVTFDYYAPQDVPVFRIIAFTGNGNPSAGASNQIVTGSGTYNATLTLTAAQASSLTDLRVGSTDFQTGKTLYIKNLKIKVLQQNVAVHTWYDQSDNSQNATQEIETAQPLLAENGNLFPDGIKFTTGKNLTLSGTGLDIFKNTQHAQVFYAIKINDTIANTRGFFEARTGLTNARFLLRNATSTDGRTSLGGRRLDGDSFASFQSNVGHSNEKIVLTGFINYSDTDAFIFQNGTQIGSRTSFLTAGATSDTRSTIISIGRAGASLTAEFDAEELIIFNTDQTANRTAIETNIANAHGITLS